MRRTEPIQVGDLLKNVIGDHPQFSRLFVEARVIEVWKGIGPEIAAHTTRVTLVRGRLNVWVDSAALRHEIFMRRGELVAQVNRAVGVEAVKAVYVK